MTDRAHERTLDTEAADLREVAALVVDEHRAAPCAVVGAARRLESDAGADPSIPGGRPRGWQFGWGAAGRPWSVPPEGEKGKEPPRATAQLVFDLASLTKPVVALTLARLERASVLHRGEPLAALLPELADTPSGSVSLDLLCAHRAGLEAHRPFFVAEPGARQPSKEQILREAAEARRPECTGGPPEEGFAPVYSDLSYILVGEALARRSGRPLDALVTEEVAHPLGLTLGSVRQLLRHEPLARRRFVPTEVIAWRGGVLRGVVHDENAWILEGEGTAGHAGLFGDVWSVVRLGTAILDAWTARKTEWLTADQIEPLVRARPGGSHAAGFDRRSSHRGEGRPSSGTRFGPQTVGHLGFTGTSIWLDPASRLVGVLLTNRVHPSREHIAIRAARPAAYDALFTAFVGD